MRAHVGKLREGRAQHDPRRRMPHLEGRDHAGAQDSPKDDLPRWVPEFLQGPDGRVRVGGQAVLAGLPGLPP